MRERFELPALDYFEAGNGYSGGRGSFNYKIFNSGGTLRVDLWYGVYCHAKSEVAATAEFAVDEAGFAALRDWLEEQADRTEPT